MTLKHQLQIMMWLFLLLFLFTQLLYTSCFLLISHRNSLKNNANLLQQVGQNIDNFCAVQTQIAASVSSNKYVHNYMTSNDALQRQNLLRTLTDFFSYTYLINSDILDIAIVDEQDRLYGSRDIPSLAIWQAVRERYEDKNLNLQTDTFFDLISTRCLLYTSRRNTWNGNMDHLLDFPAAIQRRSFIQRRINSPQRRQINNGCKSRFLPDTRTDKHHNP